MYQVSSSTVCFFVTYIYIKYAVLAEAGFLVFSKKYIVYIYNFTHDDVRQITELYLTTKFHVFHLPFCVLFVFPPF